MATVANGRRPHIYADGDRVFIDIGLGAVLEASILTETSVEQITFSDVECSSNGMGHPIIRHRGRIVLEFQNFRIHTNKQLSDIPKELAGTLSVMDLFGVIDEKLTERENAD